MIRDSNFLKVTFVTHKGNERENGNGSMKREKRKSKDENEGGQEGKSQMKREIWRHRDKEKN